jgi:hypothetical protein
MRCSWVVLAVSSACLLFRAPAWSETNPNTAALQRGSLIEIQIDHDVGMPGGKTSRLSM